MLIQLIRLEQRTCQTPLYITEKHCGYNSLFCSSGLNRECMVTIMQPNNSVVGSRISIPDYVHVRLSIYHLVIGTFHTTLYVSIKALVAFSIHTLKLCPLGYPLMFQYQQICAKNNVVHVYHLMLPLALMHAVFGFKHSVKYLIAYTVT